MPLRRVRTPVEQLQPFKWGRIVGLREAEWAYRRIAAHVGHSASVVCRCFHQRSVKHPHIRRPRSGRPHSTDARQDQRIVRAAVSVRTASGEEIRAHVALAVSPRIIGNSLLAARVRSRAPQARVALTPRYCQARLLWCRERVDWRVEWRSVVFSDESRFSSVCE